MAKNSIRDFDNTSGNNTDIQSVDISEGCSPAGINNAIREMMADLADVNDGTVALTSPSADSMTTDTISEKTADNGVSIDGTNIKDNAVKPADASGTDTAGTALTIKGGAGTGTGAGGSIVFQTADGAASTGSSVNAHATQMTITDDGNVGIGTTSPTSYLAEGDNLVVENSGNVGMTLATTSGGETGIFFADGTSGTEAYRGIVRYNHSSDYMEFRTAANEAMRMTSAGTLLIGTTDSNPVVNNVKGMLFAGSTGAGQFSRTDNAALFLNRGNNGIIQQFYRAGSAIGYISVTTSAVNYSTTSDYRLKENVTDITDAITRVKQLDPKRFNFIAEPDTTVDGFLAHEVADVVPEAIQGEKDATEPIGNVTDADGNTTETGVVEPDQLETGHTWTATGTQPVYQGIDQAKLVPVLTAALQEAIAKIETLETKVAALEAE